MATPERPSFIVHWSEIESPDVPHYFDSDELMGIAAPFGPAFGLTKMGIDHLRLPPGRRTSLPHAHSSEEEFVYVIEGEPDVWINGNLHRLKPGDGVGFPAGTGIAHSFLNNTQSEVVLLVVGETGEGDEHRLLYPVNLDRRPRIEQWWWDDAPELALGPHDGLPDRVRAAKGSAQS